MDSKRKEIAYFYGILMQSEIMKSGVIPIREEVYSKNIQIAKRMVEELDADEETEKFGLPVEYPSSVYGVYSIDTTRAGFKNLLKRDLSLGEIEFIKAWFGTKGKVFVISKHNGLSCRTQFTYDDVKEITVI